MLYFFEIAVTKVTQKFTLWIGLRAQKMFNKVLTLLPENATNWFWDPHWFETTCRRCFCWKNNGRLSTSVLALKSRGLINSLQTVLDWLKQLISVILCHKTYGMQLANPLYVVSHCKWLATISYEFQTCVFRTT